MAVCFCKRGQGLVDGLGSCWTPNTRLTIWFLLHKKHQTTPLYSATHSRYYCKKEKMVFTAFLDLLAAYDSIPREKPWRHLQKLRLHNIWEISSKPCTQDASTFLMIATKLPGRLRPTKAWNRAALWASESPSVPFIPMTLTDSWLCREVLPLP